MRIACLDLEGVLIPEIWIAVAARTGIDALRQTTRDNPDYDDLMRSRLNAINQAGLTIHDIRDVVAEMTPLDGAVDFLNALRSHYQVAILSDTFYDMAMPLIAQLGHPFLLCHNLDIDDEGVIRGYRLRQGDPKRHAVKALQSLNFTVIAAGDSHNDLSMLSEANKGFLFCPPDSIVEAFPDLPVTRSYDALLNAFVFA